MDQCFANPEIQQRVGDIQEESTIELSNFSRERMRVGETVSTVTLVAPPTR